MNASPAVPQPTKSHSILVIGYGNQLLCDDAIGPRIADEVAIWRLPQVKSLTVQQLTPELAGELANTETVIFIDACRLDSDQAVRVTQIAPRGMETTGSTVPSMGHTCDPRSLLALTHSVYGYHPQAWWVEVRAIEFAVGEHLSTTAEKGIVKALDAIQELIQSQLDSAASSIKRHA